MAQLGAYSGCPAMQEVQAEIKRALHTAGFAEVRIKVTLTPAWTTDWLSPAAREELSRHGIVPPRRLAGGSVTGADEVPCPQCGSRATELVSSYGSTACKALHRCLSCLEPFERFKCH
jgi:ring-1,2-phenylacetyl-CoA epoxidase subunit PaaD